MQLKSKSIHNFTVYFRNEEELDKIYEEIFVNEEYRFSTREKAPLIIDCGSHIGLSIFYFKHNFPNAKIIGFEPNQQNFEILTKNVEENKLTDVTLVNAAVSDQEGEGVLYNLPTDSDPWTWGDTIMVNQWGDGEKEVGTKVNAVKLSEYINSKVAFLKVDVEGAEQKIIREIEDKLSFVDEMVVEYHGTNRNQLENRLDIIISVLQKSFPTLELVAANMEEKVAKEDRDRADPVFIQLHAKK